MQTTSHVYPLDNLLSRKVVYMCTDVLAGRKGRLMHDGHVGS